MEELRGARFAGNGDGRSSVLAGMAATARERAGEEGENEGVLPAESLSSSDGSGRPSSARIDGGDPRVASEEDDDADGDAVRPGLLILSAQMRKTFSQQLDTGRGLGCTMATVLVVGGDGYVRSRSRKGLEGEGENRGSSERVGRTGTTPRRGFAASRCPRTQAGSLVAWRSRAPMRCLYLCLLAEVGDDWQRPVGPGHCWAGVGRQVSQVKVFLFPVFFSIF